ncbi:uncharacterized protein [Nicotiana sylvestris]|uniref:uncharacterized protein n=1 Tax=Nicotiana sylvestris TaxID=4096 RepID=UPI00388C64F8
MVMTTRSGRGGEASTSKQKEVVSDVVDVHNDDDPTVDKQMSEENVNGEVGIDIHDNEGETQNDVNPSREHVIDIPKMVMPKAKAPLPRPPPPYPQKPAKQKNENQFKKFIVMMKSLSINVPLVEDLEQMPGYTKFIKDLVTKKRSMDCETIKMTYQVSAIVHSMAPKLEDPDAFTVPCTIGSADFAKALCDLGASINLMPYSIFKILGIGQPRATSMRLQMAYRTMKWPLGIIDDVLVRVDKFILLADFMIIDCEVDYEVPIILKRPFLEIGKPNSTEVCSFVDRVAEVIVDETSAMINLDDPLEAVLLNYDVTEDEGLVEYVNALQGMGSYSHDPRKLSLDLENRKTPPTKPSIEEPPVLELKPLPPHLRYVKVVKKEIIKWLDAGVVYPISDSSWTSSVQCVQKRDGVTVVTNEQNEFIPTRTVTGWRVCMDYRKLNKVTHKDHFPLPFLDQMVDRLAGCSYYCFLDGYSGYNQIMIAPKDQEKITFTCPYGTFAFLRMPFGLCNASPTF